MSASTTNPIDELVKTLDECETVGDALAVLLPDPDHSFRDAVARMATALALTGEESISFEYGPVTLTMSSLNLDDFDTEVAEDE